MTKGQIDKLGQRLREEPIADDEKRLLDTYRATFTSAYEQIIATLAKQLQLAPTGRIKSNSSIVAKLRRQEAMNLSRMQDIAGCRLVLADISAQDAATQSLLKVFSQARPIDRRQKTSHGYRAVHVIVKLEGKPVEIQVRTMLQHLWAELSEKLSDVLDPALKYGGGPSQEHDLLLTTSSLIAEIEQHETTQGSWNVPVPPPFANEARKTESKLAILKMSLFESMQAAIKTLERPKP